MPLVNLDLARRAGLTQFGEPVAYDPVAGPAFELSGVWRGEHVAVDLAGGEGAELSTVEPILGVDLAEFLTAGTAGSTRATGGHAAYTASRRHEDLVGDRLTRAGVTYRVDDVQPDGQGGADLILHVV